MSGASLARALGSWGEAMPAWVRALADACDRTSQKKVGAAIGLSASTINQVLGNKYRGDVGRVQTAVGGHYLHETLLCPVLGEVRKDVCVHHQKVKFKPTSALRVRLSRACPVCRHSLKHKQGENDAE